MDKHNTKHEIINDENKNYICSKHNEPYAIYCKKCNKNLCLSCQNKHKYHNNISFEELMPDLGIIKNELNKLKETVDIFNEIKNIINNLNKVMKNLDIFYNICNNIINIVENKNQNYELIENLI
jgi:hypothetical protein